MVTTAEIEKAIPAEFHMISGSADTQTSADVFNVSQFELPNPAGKAGGACTAALLEVLYQYHRYGSAQQDKSWVKVLRSMRTILLQKNFDQVPQLTSSRLIDVNKTMHIVPPGCTGNKRALLIGINYVGQNGELRGCHNDVANIKEYLINVEGFLENNLLILMDDGQHSNPTKENIEQAFHRIVQYNNAGDVVFIHYSGHGSRVKDTNGDEDDGFDETLVPVDYASAGQIVDDDILKILVKPMKAGVNVTVLMDCCHSGTALDLPFRFNADDDQMKLDQGSSNNILSSLGGMDAESAIGCAMAAMCFAQIFDII